MRISSIVIPGSFLFSAIAGCSKGVCTDDKLNLQLIDFTVAPSDTIQVSEFDLNDPALLINIQYYRPSPVDESTASVYAVNSALPNPAFGYNVKLLHSDSLYLVTQIKITEEKCGHGNGTYKAISSYSINGTVQTGQQVIIHH